MRLDPITLARGQGCYARRNQDEEADKDSMNSLCCLGQHGTPLKPDDHSELVPLLPIPNRTVKRLGADDSADSRVKVGHRQATYSQEKRPEDSGRFFDRSLLTDQKSVLECKASPLEACSWVRG